MSRSSKPSSGSSGIGGMFKSITKSFKGGLSQTSPSQVVQPTVVGGTRDLNGLLEKVTSANSPADRIRAADSIRSSIDSYSVSSIPEIWYSVEDMVSSTYTTECRRAGIKLMISCIERDHSSRTSRMSYYSCIVKTSNLQDFDLQLEAIKKLTSNGSNLSDFFQVKPRIAEVLSAWFRSLALETQEIRIGREDISKSWGNTVEENFHALLHFIVEVFRHNHSLFSERDIFYLVKEATLTCRKTSSETDMSECLSLIDAIMSCAFMPIENLPGLLEVLCGVAGIPSRADQAWNIVLQLSESYISNNTFACLCKILEETSKVEVNSNTMRGAARYLQRLVHRYVEQKREAEISILKVMHAYNASLVIDSLRHNNEICSCIYNLLEDPATRERFTYDVWESRDYSPLEIIYRISNTPAIQKFASHPLSNGKAPSISMLSSLSLASTGDKSQAHHSVKKIIEKFKQIFNLIAEVSENGDFHGPKEVIIDFFVDMSPFIDEKCALIVIDHFKNSHFCNPLSRNWVSNTDELLLRFFQDMTWGSIVRQRVLHVVQDTYEIAKEICESSKIIQLINKVFRNVEDEPDNLVLETMVHMFEEISKDATPEVLDHISNIFLQFFTDGTRRKSVGSFSTIGNDFGMTNMPSTTSTSAHSIGPSFGAMSPILNTTVFSSNTGGSPGSAHYTALDHRRHLVTTAVCKIFVNTFRTSAVKARITYYNLLTICQKAVNEPLVYIEAARLLCRLRASADCYIYITKPTNMDDLATALGRNVTVMADSDAYKSTMSWWYPETISYLNDEDLEEPSWVLKRHTGESSHSSTRARCSEYEIDISLWFNEILRVIETGGHWEIYSFIWAHLGPQLSNIQLFQGSGCDIHRLRQTICDQLSTSPRQLQVTFPKDVTRNDIKVLLINTTSFLISYRDMFTKRDEDYIVRALVEGLSISEKAVVPSIHALLVCCYELPLSIKKFLGQIFTKFQTKITNSSTSPHILEFLLSLSRLPSLTDNFTQDEYKRVFGMAIKYIQYAYDLSQQEKNAEMRMSNTGLVSGSVPGLVPGNFGTNSTTTGPSNSLLLSQYLLVLAYNVVATWFLTLRVSDRKYMTKFIIRNLILAEGTSEAIDTQSMAYVDLISRFTYSNLDLTVQTTVASTPVSDQSSRMVKQWIYGSSIVSISTDTQTGESQITIRRPTGTSVINLKPDEKMIPGWLEEYVLKLRENSNSANGAQRLRADTTTIFTPNYFFLQLMIPIDTQQSVKPLPIPSDAATTRAISAFDRTPVVDFHKVGVMYVGPGQQDELTILENSAGSVNYRRFLDGVGKLVRLKDNRKVYTGGLDITNDIDGEYAYVWNDKVTQLIFHTTTMMPPPANPHDLSYASKKRHIGNDFVNIYFDESRLPFEFDRVKSQFNFINIVISPISCAFCRSSSFIEPSSELEPTSPTIGPLGGLKRDEGKMFVENKIFYQVRAFCKPGVPVIFAACQLKIVSEDSLAVFVRNLAIIASKFATVWNSQGDYISHWQYRLEQINKLREKTLGDLNKSVANTAGGIHPVTQQQLPHQRGESIDKKEDSTITQSFLDQLSSFEPTDTIERMREASGPSPVPAFSMDEPEVQDDDMPLLKHLDFSYFT